MTDDYEEIQDDEGESKFKAHNNINNFDTGEVSSKGVSFSGFKGRKK